MFTVMFNFKTSSTSLCLALSVLNQSSPMMNVKMSESTDTFFLIFNYFPLEKVFLSPLDLVSTSMLCYCTYFNAFHDIWCIFSTAGDK